MEKVTVWTNDFYWTNNYRTKIHDDVDKALAEGKAVMVGASCIGHTRAAMVRNQAKRYFESIGAVEVETDEFGDRYYALPTR